MIETKVDANNLPEWAKAYFIAFSDWKESEAPPSLPADVDGFVELYARHINIDFEVNSNPNAEYTAIESFTFVWKTPQDQTLFLLRF